MLSHSNHLQQDDSIALSMMSNSGGGDNISGKSIDLTAGGHPFIKSVLPNAMSDDDVDNVFGSTAAPMSMTTPIKKTSTLPMENMKGDSTPLEKTGGKLQQPPRPVEPTPSKIIGKLNLLDDDDDWDKPALSYNALKEAKEEPMLVPNKRRFVLFPIHYPDFWKAYKNTESLFWSAEEVELSDDFAAFENLTGKERACVLHCVSVLSLDETARYFNRIVSNLSDEIQVPEARCYYGFQIMQRSIHHELFNVILDLFQRDPVQKGMFLGVARACSSVSKQSAWIERHILDTDALFSHRVYAFAVYCHLFDTATMTTLLHLGALTETSSASAPSTPRTPAHRGSVAPVLPKPLLPGLVHSACKVFLDRARCVQFCKLVLSHCTNKVPPSVARQIVSEAIECELESIKNTFDVCGGTTFRLGFKDFTHASMNARMKVLADRVMNDFGFTPMFETPKSMLKNTDGVYSARSTPSSSAASTPVISSVTTSTFPTPRGFFATIKSKSTSTSVSTAVQTPSVAASSGNVVNVSQVVKEMESMIWVDQIIAAEAKKEDKSDTAGTSHSQMVNKPTPQQINVRQEFTLDEDF